MPFVLKYCLRSSSDQIYAGASCMILQIIERGENGSPVNGIRNCSVGSKVLLLDTNIGMNPPKLSNLRGSHFLKSLTNHHAVVSSPFLSESACCAFCFCGVGLRLLMLVPPIVVRFISVFSELLINFCSSCQWLMPFFVFAPLARQRSFVIALDMRKKTTRFSFCRQENRYVRFSINIIT